MSEIEIQPLRGFGDVLLGMTRQEIVSILGQPAKKTEESYGTAEVDENWEYARLGIILSFAEDDDWRLGTITFEASDTILLGNHLLQQPEAVLTELFRSYPDLELELDDEFPVVDARDYWCEQLSLSFWVHEGRVDSVTLFPEYVGDNPVWPKTEA